MTTFDYPWQRRSNRSITESRRRMTSCKTCLIGSRASSIEPVNCLVSSTSGSTRRFRRSARTTAKWPGRSIPKIRSRRPARVAAERSRRLRSQLGSWLRLTPVYVGGLDDFGTKYWVEPRDCLGLVKPVPIYIIDWVEAIKLAPCGRSLLGTIFRFAAIRLSGEQ